MHNNPGTPCREPPPHRLRAIPALTAPHLQLLPPLGPAVAIVGAIRHQTWHQNFHLSLKRPLFWFTVVKVMYIVSAHFCCAEARLVRFVYGLSLKRGRTARGIAGVGGELGRGWRRRGLQALHRVGAVAAAAAGHTPCFVVSCFINLFSEPA